MPKNTGGYTNYSLRSATEVVGWVPGAGRQNLLMDPDRALGKFVTKTYGDDYTQNGPGTISQAIPNIPNHNSQYSRIFAIPTGNPYRNFGVDDRQIASYQVEQLHSNPLSQYSTNPSGPIPSFECMAKPDNYSTMVNKYEKDYKKFFEEDYPANNLIGTTGGQEIYHQYSGKKVNPNSSIVYNMSLDYSGDVNPLISLGSSSRATNAPSFSGQCYSGNYIPGKSIGNIGGEENINVPNIYDNQMYREKTPDDKGFVNKNNKTVCMPDRSVTFANPLIL